VSEDRCYLCERPCDGTLRDFLAEYRLGRDRLPVCVECDEHLAAEPFDHKEWSR
jgi:hypothetical protein